MKILKNSKDNIILPSAVKMMINKLNKKHVILDYKKKLLKIKIYPTLRLNRKNDRIESIIGKLKKLTNSTRKKITFKVVEFNLKKYENILRRKQIEIEPIINSTLNIYSLDKDLNKCTFSFGNVIEINYQEQKRIVILTTSSLSIENFKDYNFYFSENEIDKTGGFIKFFEAIGRSHIMSQKLDLFSIGKQKFELINIEISQFFKELITPLNNFFSHMLIFELPAVFYQKINYSQIPKINLNKENTLQREIMFVSVPLDYQQMEQKTNKIDQIISKEYFSFNTVSLNFGEIQNYKNSQEIYSFKSSCIYGGIGSLIYNLNNFKEPIGINIGLSNNDENELLPFENFHINNLLKKYLHLATCK